MTLQRTLEPEVMDTLEEARDYDAMDHGEVNRLFVNDLLAAGNVRGDILDLGTGTAQIPVELCRCLDDCRIMAVDLSTNMLDLARLNIEIAGLIDRIMLDYVDAKQLPYPNRYFDIVISNSLLHHIADPSVVLREVMRVIRPGGLFFVRDLMRPESEERVSQFVAAYTAGANAHQQAMFAHSLRAALDLTEMREIAGQLGFDPQTVQPTSDRHWTWTARMP